MMHTFYVAGFIEQLWFWVEALIHVVFRQLSFEFGNWPEGQCMLRIPEKGRQVDTERLCNHPALQPVSRGCCRAKPSRNLHLSDRPLDHLCSRQGVHRRQDVKHHNRQGKLHKAIEVAIQQLEGSTSTVTELQLTITLSNFSDWCRPPMCGTAQKPSWYQLVHQARSFGITSQ